MNRTPSSPSSSALPVGPVGAAAPDADLVGRILAGDDALFELIMRRHNRLLFRLARAIVQDDDEARDVVQAAYIRAYYHLGSFRGPQGFRSWLARIAINEANGRRRKTPILFENFDAAPEPAARGHWEPEQTTMRLEIMILIQHAIERLPENFRAVFMLRGVEQLSVAETAAVLQLNEATVKTRFHRARALLRDRLGPYSGDDVRDAFPFDGCRCDEVVSSVLARLHAAPGTS